MFKILIIEDDQKLAEIIQESIKKWDYQGQIVTDFREVFNSFLDYQPHLILLDINLPYFDGFHWCNQIRQVSSIPIIFITSRDSTMDIVMAMNMGGDDFIQKPFQLEVLTAKIKALLRRTYTYSKIEPEVLEYNDVVLNIKDNTVYFQQQEIELSKNEFMILYLLMKNCGEIISRNKIMEALWKDESFIDDNTLTVNINRLRKKLTSIELDGLIQTKRGQGYLLK